MPVRILIAGVGNVLRHDDAFGVEVARRLAQESFPPGVRVVETGIAGVALVSEIQEGWDALIVVDAVDRGKPAGTVLVIEPEIANVDDLSWSERHDFLADMHLATPERALMLAQALRVLPPTVLMVGCQPVDAHEYGQGMSVPVQAAVEVAVDVVHGEIQKLLAVDPLIA
jgi:hydrogenase maturation protease